MGGAVVFGKGVLEEIRARAAASALEVCGLLLRGAGQVVEVVHCSNVAADPARAFEIDPAALIAAHRAARNGGPAIVGCYHSHPGGSAAPSPRDAMAAAPNGWLWLIVGGSELRAWRTVERGERHGRFDPVPFSIRPELVEGRPTLDSAGRPSTSSGRTD